MVGIFLVSMLMSESYPLDTKSTTYFKLTVTLTFAFTYTAEPA